MIDLREVKRCTDGHALVRDVARLPKGHVRIETGFLYPDGSSVDIFVVEQDPLWNGAKVSDLGQTMAWLLDVQVKPWMSKKRQRFVEDALRIYGVKQVGGALELPLSSLSDIIEAIVKLGQACVRVADLTYTRRSSLQTGVTEELEEFLADVELDFVPNQDLVGRRGTRVRVDFLVDGASTQSALLALASGNASQAHVAANEIFRRWYDLSTPDRHENRVTVFDDRYNVYRDEDLGRLRDLSTVIALSDRQTLQDLLAA